MLLIALTECIISTIFYCHFLIKTHMYKWLFVGSSNAHTWAATVCTCQLPVNYLTILSLKYCYCTWFNLTQLIVLDVHLKVWLTPRNVSFKWTRNTFRCFSVKTTMPKLNHSNTTPMSKLLLSVSAWSQSVMYNHNAHDVFAPWSRHGKSLTEKIRPTMIATTLHRHYFNN